MSKQDYFESGKYERSAKLFITNLPPNIPEDQLRNDIEPLFQAYGKIRSINVKKHKSGQYSYAFLQFEKIEDAIRSIEQMDQKPVRERPMKVRQDRQSQGCFNCKKSGHFAKECPLNGKQPREGKQRSRSGQRYNRGGGDYRNQRRDRRQKQRSRSRDKERSRSHSYDRRQRRYRRDRSRSKEYSPEHYRRRQYRRDRHGRSGSPRSRSRSDSYEDRGRYNNSRRGEYYQNRQREDRREGSRKYRRQSRSPSYERGERGGR